MLQSTESKRVEHELKNISFFKILKAGGEGTTEGEMVGRHHQLNGHETLGDGEGQGSLLCCSPWGRKESDVTKQPNNSNNWPKIISQKDG